MNAKERIELYEQGKHRRYGLLFAVNGGAFAIAKLLVGAPGEETVVLGDLRLRELALGLAMFTVIMVWDIFAFGLRMRRSDRNLFQWPGMTVLFLLGLLLCTGWLVAGWPGALGWPGGAALATPAALIGLGWLVLYAQGREPDQPH